MSDLVLRDNEKVVAHANWVDDEGDPTEAPANVVASSDHAALTITDNGDGSFTIETTGSQTDPGVPANVSVSGDGIIAPLTASIDVGPQ